jgi:uracil-DNA glycosylase
MAVLNTIDLDEVKQKLYERLKPSGWGDKLKTFIMSEDFDKILKQLLKEAKENNRFTPQLKQVFRAFEECPYKDLMVVMLSNDPYPFLNVADGIPFSCSNQNRVEPQLKYLLSEVQDTCYTEDYTWHPDLARWSNQGILMLNMALTTTINKSGQHYKLWQPFIAFVFDVLMYNNPGLVYVFMGKKAQEWAESVPDNNYVVYCSHPGNAAHLELEKWDSEDMFRKVGNLVQKSYNYKIKW